MMAGQTRHQRCLRILFRHTLKCLFNINGLFRTRLKVWYATFGVAECLGALRRDLQLVSGLYQDNLYS